jgi:hypothetical protein
MNNMIHSSSLASWRDGYNLIKLPLWLTLWSNRYVFQSPKKEANKKQEKRIKPISLFGSSHTLLNLWCCRTNCTVISIMVEPNFTSYVQFTLLVMFCTVPVRSTQREFQARASYFLVGCLLLQASWSARFCVVLIQTHTNIMLVWKEWSERNNYEHMHTSMVDETPTERWVPPLHALDGSHWSLKRKLCLKIVITNVRGAVLQPAVTTDKHVRWVVPYCILVLLASVKLLIWNSNCTYKCQQINTKCLARYRSCTLFNF